MPFSSGTYSLPSGNPVVTGTTISSTTTNTTNSDIATALSSCILKDGTQTVTANIPMASHKITGLSAGTTAGDSVEYGGSPSFTNLAYTGTLTGSTGILNIGSGQVYKDASGNVGIGTSVNTVYDGVAQPRPLVVQSASTATGQYNSTNALVICNSDTTTNNASQLNFAAITGASTNQYTSAVISCIYGARTNTIYPSGTLTFATAAATQAPLERMRIDSSGNVLVGTTTVAAAKVVILTTGDASASMAQTGTTGDHIYFRTSTTNLAGYISSPTGSTVSYISVSDQRLKENIVDAPSALNSINAIKVRSFDWKVDGIHQDYGYIAQELLKVAPEAVAVPSNEDEMMGVDFGKLTPRLVKAIQEQQTLIESLTARLTALEAK